MTFIVGIVCETGLVICSDSRETDGVSKRDVKKVRHYNRDRWGVAWACSGDTDIIKRFSDKMFQVLENENDDVDWSRLHEAIEFIAQSLHSKYKRAGLQIVVGLWTHHKKYITRLCFLDVRQGNCLSVEEHYACAGMDTSLGRFVLESMYDPSCLITPAITMAVFVTHLMKETADGVGGPIQVVSCRLGKPGWGTYHRDDIDRLEEKYDTAEVRQMFVHYWGTRLFSLLPPKPLTSQTSKQGQ